MIVYLLNNFMSPVQNRSAIKKTFSYTLEISGWKLRNIKNIKNNFTLWFSKLLFKFLF